MFSLVLRQAALANGQLVDIGVTDNRIAAIEPALPPTNGPEVNLNRQLTLRGFVDPHMHLDKAFLAERRPNISGTLAEAIEIAGDLKRHATRDDIAERAMRVAEMAISNGVTAIRTHVDVDPIAQLEGLKALIAVRDALKHKLAIQIVAFPQEGLEQHRDEALLLLRQALEQGADVLGGIPAWDRDAAAHIDSLFALAREFDVPLDMHVDESDDPATFTLPLIVEATRRYGYQGRVTVDHLCSLAAVPHEEAERTMKSLAQEGISVITLPSSNLYLQGRQDRGIIRRGVTRVKELLNAGVQVAAGSDNLRDPFNPFGDANPAETAWLLAHAAHMGGTQDLATAFAMVTDRAARVINAKDWDLKVGSPARLITLKAQSPAEAVITMARPTYQL